MSRGIRTSKHEAESRVVSIRRPHLLSGDGPRAVRLARCPRVDRGEVRAGLRLRKQLAPDVAAFH